MPALTGPALGDMVLLTPNAEQLMYMTNGNNTGVVPAVVTFVHSATRVNLKVLGDCQESPWFTDVEKGDGEGKWDWSPLL